jgi:hypothetical protein
VAKTKESERLSAEIGIIKKKAEQLTALDRKIARAESALTYLDEQVLQAKMPRRGLQSSQQNASQRTAACSTPSSKTNPSFEPSWV